MPLYKRLLCHYNCLQIGAYAGFSNHFNLGALMEKHMQFRGQCYCCC